MERPSDPCATCYGTGETSLGGAPEVCPDCFGEGRALSRGTKLEWRLRAIENAYRSAPRETGADVLWLVSELRLSREALIRILARCQDAEESDALAHEIANQANAALGMYDPS
jgi:hypothetical protein